VDAANNQKIVGYFIEEAQEHLETLEKGILELSSAVNDQETINELFRAAHSVKGGAAMLGFTSIQKSAHRLEDAFKILRDQPVEVDQTLEGLFLKGYDTLQDLLERLQGPFGLQEEEGEEIMKEAEPHFQQLLEYLQQSSKGEVLTSESASTSFEPQATVESSKSETISPAELVAIIRQLLKEMLSIFKQQSTPENRQQLQNLCDDLGNLVPKENGWQSLIERSKGAIANPKHSYQLLAPVIIKEIKLASDLLAEGRGNEIKPSGGLEQLAAAKIPQILISLEPKIAADTLTKVFDKQQLSQLVQILQTAC
jgi:chemotaxis protein histidine kinase CheA